MMVGHLRGRALAALLIGASLAAPGHAQHQVVIEIPRTEAGTFGELGTARVQEGDEVILRWTSDTAHLHGYDVTAGARAGEPGEMRFTAEVAGRFGLEAHISGGAPIRSPEASDRSSPQSAIRTTGRRGGATPFTASARIALGHGRHVRSTLPYCGRTPSARHQDPSPGRYA